MSDVRPVTLRVTSTRYWYSEIISPKMPMNEQKWLEIAQKFDNDIEKIPIRKSVHLESDLELSNGKILYGEPTRQQWLSRMNQYLKIGLPRTVGRLSQLGDFVDNSYDGATISPRAISDALIRIGELLRKPGTTFAYNDKKTNIVYGIVSNQHTFISDMTFYNQLKEFSEAIGEDYNMTFWHSTLRSRIMVNFPNIGIEIKQGDNLGLSIYAGNSMFGHASLTADVGILRYVCTNGSYLMDSKAKYWQEHRVNAKLMLTRFLENLNKGFAESGVLLDKLKEASEITEKFIDDKTSLAKWLPENFDIRVAEAQAIFSIMKSNPDYNNTGFWVGQAIAEYASNIPVLDVRERLERVAGMVMIAQL